MTGGGARTRLGASRRGGLAARSAAQGSPSLAWLYAVTGILAILFAAALEVWPPASVGWLVYAFGVWAFGDGVVALAAARRGGAPLLLEGIAGVAAGMVVFLVPRAAEVGSAIAAAWALVTGVLRLLQAARFEGAMHNEAWLILGGVVSIGFGVLLLVAPHASLSVLVVWIANFAFFLGALLLAASLHLRRLAKRRT